MSDLTDADKRLAIQLGTVVTELNAIDAEQLAVYVMVSTIRGSSDIRTLQARLVLQFVMQMQALTRHKESV